MYKKPINNIITERQARNRLRKELLTQHDYSGRRHNEKQEMRVVQKRMGFVVYVDNDTSPDMVDYAERFALVCIKKLYAHYKKLFSMGMVKMPKNVPVLVTDIMKYKDIQRKNSKIPGFFDPATKFIYIDQYHVDDPELWIHEYAHYISYIIPDRFIEYANEEYGKMLSEYFKYYVQKRTTRKQLDSSYYDNPTHRAKMAKYLGLPTDYASSNSDEFFAEMLTHWNDIPDNKITFRLKQVMRKILMML